MKKKKHKERGKRNSSRINFKPHLPVNLNNKCLTVNK